MNLVFRNILITIVFLCSFCHLNRLVASGIHDERTEAIDTLQDKSAQRKAQRKENRKQLKKHFYITIAGTYASLTSTVRFESPSGLFSAQLGLERHLGLDDRQGIFSGSLLYRITPRSGLYASYYGLQRRNDFQLEQDIVFLGDTLHKGSLLGAYFNTQVFSIGYLLSILTSEKSFLGVYFNAYLINLSTGIDSEVMNIDKSVGLLAPLPNFGLAAMFTLNKWLTLSGGFGIFFLNANGINGSFADMNVNLAFIPAKWISLNVGYQVFDVSAGFPAEEFRAIIDYNFNGPSFGMTFRF